MTSLARTIQSDGVLRTLAITPDGARIVAGSDNDVVVWDTRTGRKLLDPLKGHRNTIWSVAVSPDGRTFASGAQDKEIRIWDTETGHAVLGPLTGHTGTVCSVVFSPDGHLLVSGSADNTIRIWDARTGQQVGVPIQAGSNVYSVTMSPDGTKLAAGCHDHAIRLYDTTACTLLFQCVGHTNFVMSIAFSTDGRLLVSGSGDQTVRIWDAATGLSLGSPLHGHTDWVRSVAFSPDGRYIASGSSNNAVRMWDARTRQAHGDQLLGHTNAVCGVAFTPDGRFLVSGCYDGVIKIWDMRSDVPNTQNSRQSNHNLEIEITSETRPRDIIAHLINRGCLNISGQLDWTATGDHRNSCSDPVCRCKLDTGLDVAVKTTRINSGPSEGDREMFRNVMREICTWSKSQHLNVQPLLGLVEFREQIGLVVTWEPNGKLPMYLESHPEVDRCKISSQVAEGLAYLHEQDLVHGDLKGTNVLVSNDGTARLAGFGSAMHEYMRRSSNTSEDPVSSRWAAPELFKDGKCNKQTDIYALGMTILEIITGAVPWSGKNVHTVILAVVFEKSCPERPMNHIPTNSACGDILWVVLKSCWRYEPQGRPGVQVVASSMKFLTQEGLRST